jgi:hypothetical protein
LRFIRRARRTKAVRLSESQRRSEAPPGIAAAGAERREVFAVTFDRVLICNLAEIFAVFTCTLCLGCSWLLSRR